MLVRSNRARYAKDQRDDKGHQQQDETDEEWAGYPPDDGHDAVQDRKVQRLGGDLLEPFAAVFVDQVRDQRADEAEERDRDMGKDRPGLLIALRDGLQVRIGLLRVAGLIVLLRRVPLLPISLLTVRLLVRVAVGLVALLIAGLLIWIRILVARLLVPLGCLLSVRHAGRGVGCSLWGGIGRVRVC